MINNIEFKKKVKKKRLTRLIQVNLLVIIIDYFEL